MSFSYASSVITQVDDTGKTLSSVASTTGGITCTVTSHGYSDGDRVFISGTTDYNGLWDISNTATNTFDIVNQVAQEDNSTAFLAYTSSQSGTVAKTDKDLSGLSGLTGVTTTTSDPSSTAAGHVQYEIDFSTKFEIQGHLLIDPNVNTLVIEGEATDVTVGGAWTATPGNPPVRCSSGGCLYLGVKEKSTDNDIIKYSSGTAINYTYQGENQFSLYLSEFESGTSWYCNGGQIRCSGAHVLRDGAYLVLNALELYASVATGNDAQPQIRVDAVSPSTNYDRIDIYGLTLNGDSDAAIFSKSNFNTLQLTLVNGGLQTYNGGSDAVTLTDLDNINNFAPLDVTETSANTSNFGIVTVQNFSRRVSYGPSGTNRYGYMRCLRQLAVPVTDLGGSGITYSYYGVDIDNSSRGTGSVGSDDTADIVYSGTDQTGNITDNVLVETQRFDSGDSVATVDDRTDTNDAIPLKIIGYSEQIATYAPNLIGLGSLTTAAVLTPDLLVTQSTRATVDAYTTIDDAFELYDRAKSYLCANYAGEASTLVSRSGSQIELAAVALVIDSGAVSAFAYSATGDGTITIDSNTFTGGATATTGDVTVDSATVLSGGTFDCDIDYNSTATTLTDVTCSGSIDFSTATTYTIDGGSIDTVTSAVSGVTLDLINGASITTNGSPTNITIRNPVTVKVTVTDTAGSPIQNARVYVEAGATGPATQGDVLLAGLTDVSGVLQDTDFDYQGDQSLQNGRVRKASSPTYYVPGNFGGTIGSSGFETTVILLEDV